MKLNSHVNIGESNYFTVKHILNEKTRLLKRK